MGGTDKKYVKAPAKKKPEKRPPKKKEPKQMMSHGGDMEPVTDDEAKAKATRRNH